MDYNEIEIGLLYKHTKSGDIYEVVDIGKLKMERGQWCICICYRSATDSAELYVRTENNFCRSFKPITQS